MKFILATLLLLSITGAPQRALANTDELVTSIHHGGNPFMVVTKDQEGGSNREPGIYGRSQESWRQILKGNVLQDDRKGFWLKQLKLSQKDELYHTLLVVDGRLHLVNLFSDPSVPGSELHIGSPQFPLIEVLTGQKRTLPNIHSVDDVSVVSLEQNFDELDFQLVLVSVRCDSCSGDGITFAIAVKPMTNGRSTYELIGKPWVLDYKFYPQTALGELVVADPSNKRNYRLRSGVATDFIQSTDLSVFSQHESLVAKALADLLKKNSNKNMPPVEVDLRTGQLSGAFSPSLEFKHPEQLFKYVQHYDMRSQVGKLTIQNEGEEVRPMLLDFKSPGEAAIFGEGDLSYSIFSANGKLFLAQKSYNLTIVELGDSPAGQGDFELYEHFVSQNSALESGITRKILFISTKFANGTGKVDAYRLAYYSTGAVLVEDRVTVLDKGLVQPELKARVSEVEKNILFDSLTPLTSTVEEYKQIVDRSKPLINITDSKSGRVAYAFGEPLHRIESAQSFEYREYAPSKLIANASGLYSKSAQHKVNSSIGQILTRAERDEHEVLNEIPVLSEVSATKTESLGPISIKIMALDPTFNKGAAGFKLVSAISSGEKKFPTLFTDVNVPIPFKNLLSVRAFMGRKAHEKNIVIVLGYELEKDGKMLGFTTAITVQIAAERGSLPNASVYGKEMLLAKEVLDSSQILDRMVFDEDGRLNFVMTPKLARDDRRFEMMNVFERRQFRPSSEKGVKLIWDSKPSDEFDHFEEKKIPWRLPISDLEKRFPFITKRTKDAEAGYLWGKLFDLLDKMAQEKTSNKIKILLVPESMKKYVNEVILTRYGRRVKERDTNPFNWANRSLKVFQLDPEASNQDDFLDNLDMIQRQNQNSNMILADMAQINNVGRPAAKTSNFHLRLLQGAEEGSPDFGEETVAEEEVQLPHALYLLAAGEPLQPDELAKKPTRNYNTLIVSTKDEFEEAKMEAEPEIDVGLDNFFEVIDFPLPTPEDQARLLAEVFEDKNVKILRYQFDAKGIARQYLVTAEAQMTKVLEYAVMRVASEAENANMDGLTAFVQFRNLFAQQLLKDRTARRSQVIDKAFVERVLTSVFDIPVNLESLPPDDPIFILSRKDAVRMLQDKGVEGPFAIKARVIKTMLSVLKFDPTRSIPSSHIFIGESGSGKTRMVTGILDWLFPVRYDFNNPSRNYDAQSIRINVGKMVESRNGGGKSSEQLTFEEVRDHINNFLTFGFRGAIFFDDFHAAPESVRTQLLGFVRTLMETQGLYSAPTLNGEYTVNVPLRHLHLFINLNPTENQNLIDSYRKEKDRHATFEEILLASLSTKDMKVERSFLKRVGAIHNLMKFAHGAKAPALSKDSLMTARDIMLRKQKLVINSAGAIRAVADNFPDMDARTFLSTASAALVDQVDPQLFPNGTLFHVVPGRRRLKSGFSIAGSGESHDNSDKGRIEEFVERSTKVLPLNDTNPESQLQFIRTLSRNYRLPLFEQFLISLEDDVRFSESIDNQRNFLLPAMMGLRDHLNENLELPLSELGLDPAGFNLKTAGDKALFKEIMDQISPTTRRYFPIPISKTESAGGWDILLTGRGDSSANSRPAMITRYYHRVLDVIQKNAKRFYHLDSLEGMPNPDQWVRKLPMISSEANLRPSIEELRELYWKFIADINDPSLRDRSEITDSHIAPYSIARIFYFLVDKAIGDLPWIQIDKHIIRSLDQVVQDQVLGQSPGVKSYFFDYKYSPIRASSPELIMQLVESSQLSTEYSSESQTNVRRDYSDHCERLLESKP